MWVNWEGAKGERSICSVLGTVVGNWDPYRGGDWMFFVFFWFSGKGEYSRLKINEFWGDYIAETIILVFRAIPLPLSKRKSFRGFLLVVCSPPISFFSTSHLLNIQDPPVERGSTKHETSCLWAGCSRRIDPHYSLETPFPLCTFFFSSMTLIRYYRLTLERCVWSHESERSAGLKSISSSRRCGGVFFKIEGLRMDFVDWWFSFWLVKRCRALKRKRTFRTGLREEEGMNLDVLHDFIAFELYSCCWGNSVSRKEWKGRVRK